VKASFWASYYSVNSDDAEVIEIEECKSNRSCMRDDFEEIDVESFNDRLDAFNIGRLCNADSDELRREIILTSLAAITKE